MKLPGLPAVEQDAPDAPPVLTVEALIASGLARRMRTPGSKTGTTIQVGFEGHQALVQNQRERAARNRAWREQQCPVGRNENP